MPTGTGRCCSCDSRRRRERRDTTVLVQINNKDVILVNPARRVGAGHARAAMRMTGLLVDANSTE